MWYMFKNLVGFSAFLFQKYDITLCKHHVFVAFIVSGKFAVGNADLLADAAKGIALTRYNVVVLVGNAYGVYTCVRYCVIAIAIVRLLSEPIII